MTAKTTITMCKRNFARNGIPLDVISDDGTNFDCQEFRNFVREWEFNFKTSSPYHQQGNGKTEAAVGIAKSLIKKCVENGEDFHKGVLSWCINLYIARVLCCLSNKMVTNFGISKIESPLFFALIFHIAIFVIHDSTRINFCMYWIY